MADDEYDETEDGEEPEARNGGGQSLVDALTSKELLIPAALSAASAVAATKGPQLVRSLTSATEQKGEDEARRLGERGVEGAKQGLKGAGLSGKIAAKALGGGGGGSGGKKTRRLPIQRWTDIAVPVERAYEAWTQFDKFPQFMHRVLNVERKGNDKVGWQEKIWFSRRQWEGRITERRKNDRIAWKTTSGMSHYGVVSFHQLSERLTRVMVTMEFEPNGMIEKIASGLRFVKRAVQADLARFKAYVEMEDVKGLEYRAVQGEDEERESRRAARPNGDRDSDRQERETRRQERRTGSRAR